MPKSTLFAASFLVFALPAHADQTEASSKSEIQPTQQVAEETAKQKREKKKAAIEKVNGELTPEQWNAVVCQSQMRTGSRIKKSRCLTVREWHHEADEKMLRAAAQLGMEPRKVRKSKKKPGT